MPFDRLYSISSADLQQWRAQACLEAQAADIPTAEIDWLLQMAGIDRLALKLGLPDPTIASAQPLSELDRQWQQRLNQRIPVQYLVGLAPWRQFTLTVSPAVLIPRPETELVIDLVMAAVPDRHRPQQWADLGTGSGAIAIGLADGLPHAIIHAVDRSSAALQIARQNAQHYGLTDRIQFYRGSWFEPLANLRGQLDGVVSNPPYIPTTDLATLQPEVAQHEPHLALDGGWDGLEGIRQLVTLAPEYLKPGGIWLIEMMAGQAAAVTELLELQGGYRDIQIYPDLAGIDRFAFAYCKE
ncbi:MAG: peptide chain release factor N(5)-glutamine methyltransferase [Elainella sp. Prado103]|jgi:release factor glutamine methyltransferase|nr:peptide chain release factor N(5)-glutamine methyltransferase [Elainella sp. Prado103]